MTDDPEAVDFILAHGTEAVALPPASDASTPGSVDLDLEGMKELLGRCAARAGAGGRPAPPMVVANPDLVSFRVSGFRV